MIYTFSWFMFVANTVDALEPLGRRNSHNPTVDASPGRGSRQLEELVWERQSCLTTTLTAPHSGLSRIRARVNGANPK